MSGEGPWAGRRLHFVGVGGAGMSGYARAAWALGAEVTGSDASDGPYLRHLQRDGVMHPVLGHAETNVPGGDGVEVVFSSAVAPENPERRAARERGLPERPRAALLAELSAMRRTIAVAGTHGKTTTCSMIVHALRATGAQPGWLIGAPPGGDLPNACWGAGEWLVIEADESDRSMLSLEVAIAVLTNVELDHHATFSSLEELRGAFRAFLARATRGIVLWDRRELIELLPDSSVEVAPYDVPAPELGPGGSRFSWRGRPVALTVLGAHNALNAAAALEAVRMTAADLAPAIGALSGFQGAGRRLERVGRAAGGARVYDDYAHHPSEVSATIAAARTLGGRRLVAVFQPHLYSRTRVLAREFGEALAAADVIVVTDIYAARERAEDHPGVSGLLIAEAAADCSGGRPVHWLPSLADAARVLGSLLGEDDVCVVMGAGDVDTLARELVRNGALADSEALEPPPAAVPDGQSSRDAAAAGGTR